MINTLLGKVNFAIGRNPRVSRIRGYDRFIPSPFKSVLLISADFELAWAWQFANTAADPIGEAINLARRERDNIPLLLQLCDSYNIPITWATVGHLFLESCKKGQDVTHPEIKRLSRFKNDFWTFSGNDWFENDPGSNFREAPEWYCPDLIKMILKTEVIHEIGCHTFSHIDCRDEICSPEVFDSEIKACINVAKPFNIQLKSFVHPAHTIGNIERLALHGFTSFRTASKNVLSYPRKHYSRIWEIQNTSALYYRKDWSVNYHINRYKAIIDRAIQSNTVCCLWFHPSVERVFIDQIMPSLFNHINLRREDILISTTGDYVDWLNSID